MINYIQNINQRAITAKKCYYDEMKGKEIDYEFVRTIPRM